MTEKLDYKDLVELGFERVESHDLAWENRYGYEYFYLVYKLTDSVSLLWFPETRQSELEKVDPNGNYLVRKYNLNLTDIKFYINLFK